MKKLFVVMIVLAALLLAGCATDADVASQNLSLAADQFEIDRRVVFYNGISGEYILVVEGRCSITADTADNQLELTCKTGPESYKKHFLGLSDNVTYFAEQLEPSSVDVYHYRVIFKPSVIIPDVELQTP
jgi:predicted small secreted protein